MGAGLCLGQGGGAGPRATDAAAAALLAYVEALGSEATRTYTTPVGLAARASSGLVGVTRESSTRNHWSGAVLLPLVGLVLVWQM